MPEITPEEIRPISRIIDEFSFEIENTEQYSQYVSKGYVFGVNFPKNVKYSCFKEQLNEPQLTEASQLENHYVYLTLLQLIN